MKGEKAKADPTQVNAAAAVDVDATDADGGTEAAAVSPAVSPAQTPSAPYQELLTTWWTTAALAWGPPVRMWSEIVATAWRPFLPPTALTTEKRAPGVPTVDPSRADGPPAQPAPLAAARTPRVEVPKPSAPGTGRRPRATR